MTASTQPTETRAQTTNGSFQTDVSALQELADGMESTNEHQPPRSESFSAPSCARDGGRPMSTNAEEFRASFERARAMEADQ